MRSSRVSRHIYGNDITKITICTTSSFFGVEYTCVPVQGQRKHVPIFTIVSLKRNLCYADTCIGRNSFIRNRVFVWWK